MAKIPGHILLNLQFNRQWSQINSWLRIMDLRNKQGEVAGCLLSGNWY